jgi:hypothetical protein
VPLIRYIYGPDVREHGEQPVMVDEVQARVLTEMRRAVRVTVDDLSSLKKAELIEHAEAADIPVPPRATNAHLTDALSEVVAVDDQPFGDLRRR